MILKDLYFQMLLIRKFEERLYQLFSEGKLFGTTHGYIGQEANAVGIISELDKNDTIFSNHRCHGHYLARTNDVTGLLAEIMGKSIGLCGGIGGSQHIYAENFYTNGIQGSFVPIITGMGLAEKINKSSNIIVGFIGDGTLGQGVVYESLNLMSLNQTPCFIVVENNQYAQTTKIDQNLAGSIKKRFEAFNIETTELTSTNVLDIKKTSAQIITKIREERRPCCLIINTYRFCSHSKSDDFRDESEIAKYKTNDPILITQKLLEKDTILNINEKVESIIEKAILEASEANFQTLKID